MTKTVSKSAKPAPKAAAKSKPAPKAAPKGKPAKVDPDLITSAKGTTSGPSKLVVVAGAGIVAIDGNKLTKQLTALCRVGGSLAAVQAYLAQHGKAAPALARGVEARINPHSSKAVQDSRATAQPAKAAPKGKPAAPKGKDFSYAKAPTADAKLATVRPDTFREYMVKLILAHKDTASAKAAHVISGQYSKERINFSWARDNGYIAY